MINLKEHSLKSDLDSLSKNISFSRSIDSLAEEDNLSFTKSVRVAVVASSTINGLIESIKADSAKCDLLIKPYLSEYNQFAQEIFNKESALYSFNPEIIFIHLDLRTLAGEIYFNPNDPAINIKGWQEETFSLLKDLCSKCLLYSNSKIVLSNLEVPYLSSLGTLENNQELGFRQSVIEINSNLLEEFKRNKDVYVHDYENFSGKIGKQHLIDEKMYYLGDMKIKPSLIPELASSLSSFIKGLFVTPKKCLVLDLDNTLWGGVIGESGINGIKLGPTPEGRSFMEFQQYILSLYNRGVILAVNSKNNYEDAIEVIKNHPHMILREEHFAALRINWDDKVKNLKSLAEEINIGLDSMVFLDDDDFNREMVKEFLPEVEVVDLPKEFSLYLNTIDNLSFFESLTLTQEDIGKGKMYSQEKQRRTLKEEVTDVEEYLKLMKMEASVYINNLEHTERISQMTQKTNQFNMTTKRYSEEEIETFIRSKDFLVFTLSLTDKFGDYGITGLAILKNEEDWEIDSFLLSCRILGRKAENALMSYVSSFLLEQGSSKLVGSYIPTKKNAVAANAYKDLGFVETNDKIMNWVLEFENEISFPESIKIIS
jgi:FkbH-like protein